MFKLNSHFFSKIKRAAVLEPAASYVRDRDETTAPGSTGNSEDL